MLWAYSVLTEVIAKLCACLIAGGRWRCLSRLCSRGALVLDLLDVLDLPGRTAELARTYGIDFFSVINR
jgi:DNA polymerase zeta